MFKLAEQRAANRGLYCGKEGLYLGSAALIERDGDLFRVRPSAEIETLLAAAFEDPPDLTSCAARLQRIAAHLQDGNDALAQITALHLGLPDLPDERIKRVARADKLLKANFNPDESRIPAGSGRESGEWTDGDEAPQGVGTSTRPSSQPSRDSGGDAVPAPKTLHGYATVYDPRLAGVHTASGDVYDPKRMTAAVLPGTISLGSVVTVTLDSDPHRSIEVYVNDHGLYRLVTKPDGSRVMKPLPGRVIDLSTAAFQALTGMSSGKVRVTVTVKSGPRR